MTPLTPWQTFYEILGSAAGGLTGLQFVAMALIADLSITPGEEQTGLEDTSAIFSTPTIVHFTCVLVLAASMVMPWPNITAPAIVGACIGLFGIFYMAIISRHLGRQKAYQPVCADWLHRAIFPAGSYCAIFVTSLVAATANTLIQPSHCLFGIAIAALLLLAMGIQNAWDNVIYIVAMKRREAAQKS